MTLKGQKNHYNIKLLRGYGVSINLRNNKIVLKGGSDVFTGQFEQEEWFVTQIPYERIVISGKGYISTEAIKLLTDKNINVILTDTYGNLLTAMHKVMSSPTAMNNRIGQYDTFRNPEKVAYLQKQLLESKLKSQIEFLKSIQRPEVQEAIDGLARYLTQIEKAGDKRDLLTIESRAGHLYFRNYAKLFPEKYGFLSRHGGGLVMSNRYASDIVNGLLNYGYTVLAGEIAKFVNGIGLDPYFGFMHRSHNSFQALVYDLIEPFRWLVENAVYKVVVEESNHGRSVKRNEYAWTREGKILLDSSLIRRFLELLERIFQVERPYKFRHGLRMKNGLSMCQELTIVKTKVHELATYCITMGTTSDFMGGEENVA
ncbi:MAG TPA: CRISPR-associated endonuclease Cas1 [Nitrososphaera sp.]|jgi:CRISPR-associated protein Cas1|nr:CRISPR-associated endonuclease Cas1 [Nitrososphaera sp.]